MSAYIVENRTINRIISFIIADHHGQRLMGKIKDAGYDLDSNAGRDRFGRALMLMNVDAVNQRHGEHDDGTSLLQQYIFQYEPVNIYQAYKSAKCLRYQCSEGNVPDTPLYAILRTIVTSLAERIADNSYVEALS